MTVHTTNYQTAFILVAEDCPVDQGVVPPLRDEKPSIAQLQFELVSENPYRFTSDEVMFRVFAIRNDLPESKWPIARTQFFSRGQPCFRSSPLTKRYGWGVHSDAEGKIALYGMETEDYQRFARDKDLNVVRAMRSRKNKLPS